jgi:hypothetical protein
MHVKIGFDECIRYAHVDKQQTENEMAVKTTEK